MSRHLTPRPVRAAGAKEAHGSILDPAGGALYVHVHRENGLAHRHYVLGSWQVRLLSVLLSRPMLILYVIALVTWGWTTSQALRVPLLQRRIATLATEAQKLDTLTTRLTELQERYDQVQRMLSAARTAESRQVPAPARPATARPAPVGDTTSPTDR